MWEIGWDTHKMRSASRCVCIHSLFSITSRSERVWVLLGNEDASEIVMVPYSRVVTSAGTVVGDVTYVEAAMVSGYIS